MQARSQRRSEESLGSFLAATIHKIEINMFSSAVKVQNYRKLLQMHETTPSSFKNDALGLDLRIQRKLFETSPIQTLKKKRNFGEMMTTHRYEDVMEPSYTP